MPNKKYLKKVLHSIQGVSWSCTCIEGYSRCLLQSAAGSCGEEHNRQVNYSQNSNQHHSRAQRGKVFQLRVDISNSHASPHDEWSGRPGGSYQTS